MLEFNCAGDVLQQEHLKKRPPDSSYNPPGNASFPQFKHHMAGSSDRNPDILKDEPETCPLRRPGMMLKVVYDDLGTELPWMRTTRGG